MHVTLHNFNKAAASPTRPFVHAAFEPLDLVALANLASQDQYGSSAKCVVRGATAVESWAPGGGCLVFILRHLPVGADNLY